MIAHFPTILVNHGGFRPESGKYVVVEGVKGADRFSVVNMRQKGWEPSFIGKLIQSGTNLGKYMIGDFSDFKQPGIYRISVNGEYPYASERGKLAVWSHDFRIGYDVWDDSIRKLVNYYRVQSCGASKQGYRSPCHTGKIPRDDGGEPASITGGWHAAHDCQRTVNEIQIGEFGLMYLAMARSDLEESLEIFRVLRWGNDYFLAIQDHAGYLYSGVVAEHYFEWEKYDWWDDNSLILRTEPAPLHCQYNFVTIQALIALHYRNVYPKYAARCLEAGERCFQYVQKHEVETSYDLGTSILAGVHMFRATGKEEYRAFARRMADRLIALQAEEGFFHISKLWAEKGWAAGYRHGGGAQACFAPFSVVGLCAAAQWLPDDPEHPRWMAALRRFASNFVRYFSEANAFGILPYAIYPGTPPQKTHEWNGWKYRYFMETNYPPGGMRDGPFYWQTGNIAIVAGYGIAMLYMAKLLDTSWLRCFAQRQLDWVLGVNPFDSSMIIGVGRNQPTTYPSNEWIPGVPDIEGAVLQGPIGDEEDNPILLGGYYATCEFWMPHHSWSLWLMAELSADRMGGP